MSDKLKARYLGEKGKIFSLGTKSFAPNVWVEVTQEEAQQIYETGMLDQFAFEGPVNCGPGIVRPVTEATKTAIAEATGIVPKKEKKSKTKIGG